MPERIQMSRQRPWRAAHPEAVKVDRSTKWGNPWIVLTPGGRSVMVQRFRDMLEGRDDEARDAFGYPSNDAIRDELAGRDLACWCGPSQECHADVLIEFANSEPTDLEPK